MRYLRTLALLAVVLSAVWASGLLLRSPASARGLHAVRQGDLGTTEFYLHVVGAKQGIFEGDTSIGEVDNLIRGLGWSYQVAAPFDPASGAATGRVQHHPVTITKEWGAASPQLLQALVTNEVLPAVQLIFVVTNGQGRQTVEHRITLTNARLVEHRDTVGTGETNGTTGKLQIEHWSFTFQKIEVEDIPSHKQAIDDWQSGV